MAWCLCVLDINISLINIIILILISERANLVDRAVDELLECGVKLVNITCDSPPVQLSMMKNLGANLDVESFDLHICKDKPGNNIYFVHDQCHAMKLVRNAWNHHKKLKNANGDIIDWSYIIELHNLQNITNLKSANKLSQNHVYFHNQKMKVKYAVQLMSRSVALSLKLCRENLQMPEFAGSEATEEFLFIMNDIFDIFNSTSKYAMFSLKRAISVENRADWLPVLGTC